MGTQNDIQTKAWSSGRVLTSVQRARKQKMDRMSKKQLQQRQQDYLETLENRINDLESILRKALKRPFHTDGHTVQLNHDLPSSPGEIRSQGAFSFNIPNCTAFQALSSTPAQDQQSMQLPFHIPPVLEYPSEDGGKALNYFHQALWILGSVFSLDPSQVCSADHLNQDILIRAVLEGWHILQHENNVCPLWIIIREIDASINIRSGPATRLAMLRGMHQFLLCLILPHLIEALPAWYRPSRPAQTLLTHDILIDYFAWPGFRERLVILRQPQLDDTFWDQFARSFYFFWSDSFSDAYEYNAKGKKYSFSAVFSESMHDIWRYRMDSEFFAKYPETCDDIY